MNDDYIVTYYHNDNLSNGTFIHENQEKKIFALNEIEYLERYINSITY